MTTTHNLRTGEIRTYDLPPERAVLNAHAQEHGDWNWWDYEGRYQSLLERGLYTVACGDWCARLAAPERRAA